MFVRKLFLNVIQGNIFIFLDMTIVSTNGDPDRELDDAGTIKERKFHLEKIILSTQE
jgi:hypothetical protein